MIMHDILRSHLCCFKACIRNEGKIFSVITDYMRSNYFRFPKIVNIFDSITKSYKYTSACQVLKKLIF